MQKMFLRERPFHSVVMSDPYLLHNNFALQTRGCHTCLLNCKAEDGRIDLQLTTHLVRSTLHYSRLGLLTQDSVVLARRTVHHNRIAEQA